MSKYEKSMLIGMIIAAGADLAVAIMVTIIVFG